MKLLILIMLILPVINHASYLGPDLEAENRNTHIQIFDVSVTKEVLITRKNKKCSYNVTRYNIDRRTGMLVIRLSNKSCKSSNNITFGDTGFIKIDLKQKKSYIFIESNKNTQELSLKHIKPHKFSRRSSK